MPQLPDYTALGGVPDANSGRPIASARSMHPGALAAGVEQLGSDLQAAGSNIDAVAQREKRQDNLVQVANADADALKRQQELHQTVTSDNDYATQPKRFEAGSNAIIQSSANAIADPRMRALWIADAQKNSVARMGVVESQAATGVKQTRVVQLKDNLDGYQSIYTNPKTDDLTRQQAQENIHSTITAAQNEGVITPEGAQQWNTTYVQGSEALRRQALIHTKDGNKAVMTPATPAAGGGQDSLQPPPGLSPAGLEIWKRNNAGDKGSVPAKPYAPSAAEQQAEITTGDKGTPAAGKVNAITSAAKELGTTPEDLATSIFYESSGDPNRWGGKGGKYLGLIQFGPDEQKKYHITPGMTFEQQMPAVVSFLKDRGFKPGMGMMDLYSTINSGSPGNYNASDGNGTVRTHIQEMDRNGSRKKAVEFLGGKYVPGESSASAGPDADPFSTAYDNLRRDSPGLSPQQYYALANEAVATHASFQVQDRSDQAAADQQRKALVDQYQYNARNGQIGDGDIEGGWRNGTFKTYEEYSSVRSARKEYLTDRDQGAGAVQQIFGDGSTARFNPFDSESKKVADNAYKEITRASPDQAIAAVDAIQKRTGIVPQSAANGLRAAIFGADQNIGGQALQVASNLLTRNPNAFAGVDGGDTIAKSAVAYSHFLEQGATTADATRRVLDMNDPAYRSKVTVKDDQLKTFTDGITPAVIGKIFDTSILPFNDPRVGVSPEQQGAITQDFKEVAEQFYKESGDANLAMAQAKAQLSRVYGVSAPFGQPTVTKYPPERSYPPVHEVQGDDGHAYVYRQATEAVKGATGKDIPAADIALLPLPHDTSQAFDAGKPAPYRLAYVDRTSGQPVLQYIYGPSGKAAFVADPIEADAAVTSGRAAAFREKQGFYDPNTKPDPLKKATSEDFPSTFSLALRQKMADQQNAANEAQRVGMQKMQQEADAPMNAVNQARKDMLGPDYAGAPTPPAAVAPAPAPAIPAAAAPTTPTLPPPTQDQAAASIQRTRQTQVDERRKKAGLPPFFKGDIPQ